MGPDWSGQAEGMGLGVSSGQPAWHLWSGIPISFRIFQFIVIHTVKGFGIVNKAEIDVFLELLLFPSKRPASRLERRAESLASPRDEA